MGGRGSAYIRQQTSEEGLDKRAREIHKLLDEMGAPAKKSIAETVEILRKRDRDSGLVFNKNPDPDKMDSTKVYREIDRVVGRLEKKYTNSDFDKFKRNYNEARSKYSKGDINGATKQLSKVPYDYIRYRALDESMYGDPTNAKKKNFYKAFH